LSNDSDRAAPEIEAIYLHCGEMWKVQQDDKVCPSTRSDIPLFKKRHFLTSPIKRLLPGTWAQIKVRMDGVIASSVKGQELRSSYKVGGSAVLRIITSEGNYDYPINVDYDLEEIPF
jgi:hypothetical protein